jgi:hypothetical protein
LRNLMWRFCNLIFNLWDFLCKVYIWTKPSKFPMWYMKFFVRVLLNLTKKQKNKLWKFLLIYKWSFASWRLQNQTKKLLISFANFLCDNEN